MKIEEFERIVWRLSNSAWVRYYLMWMPGKMILEVALGFDDEWPEQLEKELLAKGFERFGRDHIGQHRYQRWIIDRSQDQRAEGGQS